MPVIALNAKQAYALTSISHTYSSVNYWIRQMEETVKSARSSFEKRSNLPTGGFSMMEYNSAVNRLRGEIQIAEMLFVDSVHDTHITAIIKAAQQVEGFPQCFGDGEVLYY